MNALQRTSSQITISTDHVVSGHDSYLLPEYCYLCSTSPSDLPDLRRYFVGMFAETRRLRLQLWSNDVPESVLRLYDGSDSARVSGFVLRRSGSENTILGEGILARSALSEEVEMGISIADSWRGCGLGKNLIAQLILQAIQMGYRTLHADTLRENTPFIRVASSLGFVRKWHPHDGTQTRMSLALQN